MNDRIPRITAGNFSIKLMSDFATRFGALGGNPMLLQQMIDNDEKMSSLVALARGSEVSMISNTSEEE